MSRPPPQEDPSRDGPSTVVAPYTRDVRQKGDRLLPVTQEGAQRASRHRIRSLVLLALAVFTASGVSLAQPTAVAAAAPKVVIVVGPVEGKTAEYIADARGIAAVAKSYGAAVYQIYSPNATWEAVKTAAVGADILVYLGHGNGWPSPYTYDPNYTTKDGMGLNISTNRSNYSRQYYGEPSMRQLQLSPNAVVLLHRLCYASGNSEGGYARPTLSVARQRVDNYASGFLAAGASAVFAEAYGDTNYLFYNLFRTRRSIENMFWRSPDATYTNIRYSFASSRTTGATGRLDPDPAEGILYTRSVVGNLTYTADRWKAIATR
jgi:hypothetical protein